MKRSTIRAARKSAHLSNKLLHKVLTLTTKVEHKADRLLNGEDFSVQINDTVPLEKLYYNTLKYILPLNPALPKVHQKASIVLLLPTLDGKSFYGGTATALIVAGKAAEMQKRPLHIVQTLVTGKAQKLSEFFANYGISLAASDISVSSVADRAYNVYGYIPMHPDDIFIASAWWDAYLINQLPLTKKFIYLVQDFEPIFYNNSDLYILAESTYKFDSFIPLCNTKLMFDFMQDRAYPAFTDKKAQWFEPAVSRAASGLVQKKQKGQKRRLFLYGRPDVHRNLFFTALESIDYAFKANFLNPADFELVMAGQNNIPDIQLTSGMKISNLGKMSMTKYIEFSKSVDLAVSLMMAPHPNYPTLEFASIGTSVVTTKYANKQDLSKYSANIITSDIEGESLAGAIKQAAKATYDERITNAKNSHFPANWDDTLSKQIQNIIANL